VPRRGTVAVTVLLSLWHNMFDLPLSVGEKVLRPLLIYVFLVAMLRIVGKRELGQTNTLDLVVLLLVANAVQNGIIGDDLSVTGAAIGAVTLFAVNEFFNHGTYALPLFSRLVEGEPSMLIQDGKPVRRTLRRSAISLDELRSIARRQGFDRLEDVDKALLETNGVVTMFRKDEPHQYHEAEPGGPRIGKHRRARR
jgi:uncharacterized membrane protein YcaP (DUF421 family)